MTDVNLADELAATAAARDLNPDDLAAALASRIRAAADDLTAARTFAPVLDRVAAAAEARAAADAEWRTAIADAARHEVPRTQIASAAGVTRQWVSAIVRDRLAAVAASS